MVIFKRRCLVTGGFGPSKLVFKGDFPADVAIASGCVADHVIMIECEGEHNEVVVGLTRDEALKFHAKLNAMNL